MKPISTKLFEFLKLEGVLDKGEEEIKLAKIKYRNEYIRNWENHILLIKS